MAVNMQKRIDFAETHCKNLSRTSQQLIEYCRLLEHQEGVSNASTVLQKVEAQMERLYRACGAGRSLHQVCKILDQMEVLCKAHNKRVSKDGDGDHKKLSQELINLLGEGEPDPDDLDE